MKQIKEVTELLGHFFQNHSDMVFACFSPEKPVPQIYLKNTHFWLKEKANILALEAEHTIFKKQVSVTEKGQIFRCTNDFLYGHLPICFKSNRVGTLLFGGLPLSLGEREGLQLLRKTMQQVKDFLNTYESHFSRITSVMTEKISEFLTLLDVCEHTGLSESKIREEIKYYTGKSFPEYRTTLKIQEAERLLIDTNKTIFEIMFSLGYDNRSTFNRIFKRKTGIPPSVYREREKIVLFDNFF